MAYVYNSYNYPYSTARLFTGTPVFRYTYLDFTEGMYYRGASNVTRSLLNGLWSGLNPDEDTRGAGAGPFILKPNFTGGSTSYLSSADSVYPYPYVTLSTPANDNASLALSNSNLQVTNAIIFNAYINYRPPTYKSPGGTDITISRNVVTTIYSRYDYNFTINVPY